MDILEDETLTPNARVTDVCSAISSRHPGRVLGFIYYGSSLRDMDDPDKMLDFYVIVDSYRKTHTNPIRAVLNALIPPAVYYLEHTGENGILSTCKYSIMSLKAFERRCSSKALLSQTWGRFSQPCALLSAKSDDVTRRINAARAIAVRHIAAETAPLLPGGASPQEFWARAFYESYRTELRPESSVERSAELVGRYLPRYEALTLTLYQVDRGQIYFPDDLRKGAKFRWFLRRCLGKPMTAIRVINSAFTFDGGLDYILRKLKNHSGAEIEVTKSQRLHPILWSPILAWKLWRRGAFR